MFSRFVMIVFVFSLLSGCASDSKISSDKNLTTTVSIDENNVATVSDVDQDIDQKVAFRDARATSPGKNNDFVTSKTKVEDKWILSEHEDDPRVDFWVEYFSEKNRASFQQHLSNGEQYRTVIEAILEKHGVPKEIYYLGLIESGYNLKAKSSASAVGPWQFIKGTADRYKLRTNNMVDERLNIFKATEAAARYLKDLYNIFGKWDLAMAGYNYGEYGVVRGIMKGDSRCFKELSDKKLIPKETRYYIAKIVAARKIDLNREKYGFSPANSKNDVVEFPKVVKVMTSTTVERLANVLGVGRSVIREYNADLKGDRIQASRNNPFVLYLPGSIAVNIDEKNAGKLRVRKIAAEEHTPQFHKVRRGESLEKIAKKYNISISTLKRMNKIKRNRVFVGEKLKISAISRPESDNPEENL